ncbi:MAG: aldolase [Methylobacteriaceae bacterium]|nr:aldolase [Methylobacteriaceae bacterium]
MPRPDPADIRQRFLAGETLLGSFVKFPSGHSTEILGSVGFDFVVIDEEHGPFDRVATDQALMGARAGGIAGFVRVPEPGRILGALDDGALGVLVPHVASPAKAQEVAALCRYRGGSRGFSNTTRAGDYGGRGLWAHVEAQDGAVVALGMIEDREALSQLDAILATPGLDGVFIGRGDLTVALGAAGLDAPETQGATEAILAAARRAGKPACIMVASAAEAGTWRRLGASAFIVSSDQGFLRAGAAKTASDFAALRGAK